MIQVATINIESSCIEDLPKYDVQVFGEFATLRIVASAQDCFLSYLFLFHLAINVDH
jgi:hypothetical protein